MAVKKVKRRGKLVWRARVMLDGKTAVRYCSRKDEAMEAEVELRERLEREAQSEASGLPHWKGEVPTVEEFVPMWLEHQDGENRPAEMRTKRQILRDHLLPTFGGLQIDQLTTQLVDAYKARKLQDLAPNTVANHVTTLKRMLSMARDWGVITTVPRIRQVKRPATEFDFLDFEETERFLAASGSWETFMLTAIRTGLRLGELRGLQWGDVDLERRRIRVARAYTKDGWGAPKSGKGRTVDLAHDVVEALSSQKPSKASRTALVFPSESGGPLDEKTAYKACAAASRTGQLGRTVGPHKLRHTFASHHAMRGTPLPVIQAWMGHADISTTMRYAHLAPSATASFADAVAPHRGPRLVEDGPRGSRGGPTGGPTDGAKSKNSA